MEENYDKINNHRQWNRRLINLYWVCNLIILITEFVLLGYQHLLDTPWFPLKTHLLYMILLPTCLMLFFTVLCEAAFYLLRNNHQGLQPYIITFTCVAYCTVLLAIHHSISVLSTAYCIPIIFALIYNDNQILRGTFLYSLLVYLGTSLIFTLNRANLPYFQLTLVDIITAVALIVTTYLICKLIVSRYRQIADTLAATERAAYESKMAKEYAESLAETRSRFFAGISHEIRTPMNVILGLTELALDKEALPEWEQDYLKKVRSSASSLLDIVNDILDLSKIESGEIKISNRPFQLHELLNECEMLTSHEAKQKGLRLYFYNEIEPSCCVIGDPLRLRQALINILSNAVKFTPKGSVTLLTRTISASPIAVPEKNEITVYFEVSDTGIGIAGEQLEEIFKPFKQANDSIMQSFGGTGLGLSITKSIINSLGGTIDVTSIPNKGSRFSFSLTFPLSDMEAVHVANHHRLMERPFFEGDVLLCEDNELGRQVAAENLERVGLRVFFAENGEEAVQLVAQREKERKPFLLIFMDIHMPVMGGVQATERIIEMGVKTPIIALTAIVMEKDRSAYIQAGMTECLSKPFRSHEMWALLSRYLAPVNRIAGIENNAGSAEVYEGSLSYFVAEHQQQYDILAKAIENKDFVLAHRTAHTAKSNAIIIGAAKLAEHATVLEESLRRGGVYYREELLLAYAEELRVVVRYLSTQK